MTMEKKMAGFSIAAHRRYRTGVAKNRGGRDDIVSAEISHLAMLSKDAGILN